MKKKEIAAIEDASELLFLIWCLCFNVGGMTDSEKVEKIGNAVNIFYDKYGEVIRSDLKD